MQQLHTTPRVAEPSWHRNARNQRKEARGITAAADLGCQVDPALLLQARSTLADHHGTADMQSCSPCGQQLYDYFVTPVMAQPWTTKAQQSSWVRTQDTPRRNVARKSCTTSLAAGAVLRVILQANLSTICTYVANAERRATSTRCAAVHPQPPQSNLPQQQQMHRGQSQDSIQMAGDARSRIA